LAGLKPKDKQPNSANTLNNWIARAERDMNATEGGRLGWLVASTVVAAALGRAAAGDGGSRFLLKGGTMLQHRLAVPTRATKDVDGLVRGDIGSYVSALDDVLAEPWGPIGFRRGEVEIIDTPAKIIKPRRFQLTLTLRGVTWRRVQVELSPDEGRAGERPDLFPAPVLAGLGLPDPGTLVGLSLQYQIAQKLHASTDPHEPPDYVNDRARDVVDLLLLSGLAQDTGQPTSREIRAAAADIFEARALEAAKLGRTARPWPPVLVSHAHWDADYAVAAQSAAVDTPLEAAVAAVNRWIGNVDAAR
jgi:hypothetical protein